MNWSAGVCGWAVLVVAVSIVFDVVCLTAVHRANVKLREQQDYVQRTYGRDVRTTDPNVSTCHEVAGRWWCGW